MDKQSLFEYALQIRIKASLAGFDRKNMESSFQQLEEEILELKEWLPKRFNPNENQEMVQKEMEKELGDCLFALINIARQLEINPEKALLSTIHKFEYRFSFIETELAKLGKTPTESNLEEMEALWHLAKTKE